jgi:transposase
LAADQKRAARQRAHLVLIDESGLLMAPLVRRTLAPAGQTPVLEQKASHRDKVSLTAALCISPLKGRLSLRFRTYPKEYVNNERTAEFLRGLLRQLRGPVIVVWDRGNMHKGPPIRKLLDDFPRLELRQLPPYAPELNPVEQLWQHLKWVRFANFAALDVRQLDAAVRRRLNQIKRQPNRLRSFLKAADLPYYEHDKPLNC